MKNAKSTFAQTAQKLNKSQLLNDLMTARLKGGNTGSPPDFASSGEDD